MKHSNVKSTGKNKYIFHLGYKQRKHEVMIRRNYNKQTVILETFKRYQTFTQNTFKAEDK